MEEKDWEGSPPLNENEAGLLHYDDEEYQFGGPLPKLQFRWFLDIIVRVKLMFLTIVFSLSLCLHIVE